jgi:hypothetical protein
MTSSSLAWLARLAGVGHEMASKIDRVEFHWARPDLLLLGLALLVPAGWWIARRHRERMPWLSPRQRTVLNACRIAVLGVLVFVIAGPFLRLDEKVQEKPVVAMVVDASDSMQLPVGRLPTATIAATAAAAGLDPPAADDEAAAIATVEKISRLSRGELVRAVLDAQHDTTLRQLTDQFEVRRYEVARRPRRLPNQPAGPRDPAATAAVKPSVTGSTAPAREGYDTALGAGVQMALDDASDRALAALVLLTDGRSTTGIDPLDAVRRATEAAGGKPRGPVLAVPVGSIDPPADIAITDVLAAPEVAIDDTVAIGATVQSGGLAGREVSIELRDAQGTVLDTRTLKLRDGRQQVVFSWRAARAGTTVLTVAVAAEAEEMVQENNRADTTVEVSDRKAKVLVIDHAPRWDLRFIDHAIRRDTTFEPTVLLTTTLDGSGKAATGTSPESTGLPQDAKAWAAYDLVVLGDVPASILDARRQEALVEAVTRRGVGLVLQPGGDHLPQEYAKAPLEAVFPVKIDTVAGAGTAVLAAADFKPLTMLVTARGAMHPAFALSGDASRNRQKWSEMPPFFRAAAAQAPKPSATVLAEVQPPGGRDPRPLVVEAPIGNGRVLWIGTDETFRWRRNVGDPLFWRFWGQALRTAARRQDRPFDATWLVVSPARCEPGSPVFVELNLVDKDKKPILASTQTVVVKAGSEQSLALQPGGRPGLYTGSFTPESTGRHVVTHDTPTKLSGEVMVAEPTRERAQPGVDRETLQALADLSGGAMIEVAEFSSLPYRLATTSIETRASLEDDIWDTWPVLLLLVGLFCLDVGIRRLSGSS